jgi:hypothetical protein
LLLDLATGSAQGALNAPSDILNFFRGIPGTANILDSIVGTQTEWADPTLLPTVQLNPQEDPLRRVTQGVGEFVDPWDLTGIGAMAGIPAMVARGGRVGQGITKAFKRVGTTGRYVGAPPGVRSPQKLSALRKNLARLALEGGAGRFWYVESGEALLQFFGNTEDAERFAQLLAIYSPATSVRANTSNALKAWGQFNSGQPIQAGRFKSMDRAASALLYEDKPWEGRKTNTFYVNLLHTINPKKYRALAKEMMATDPDSWGAVTTDMWIMRALGYKTDTPTAQQYDFAEKLVGQIGASLGWEPQQVQAGRWVATKARVESIKPAARAEAARRGWAKKEGRAFILEPGREESYRDLVARMAMKDGIDPAEFQKAAVSFRGGLERNLGQVSWEATPGASTGHLQGLLAAPFEIRAEYQHRVARAFLDDDGRDIIATRMRLPSPGDFEAPGAWEGAVNPSGQTQVSMPREHKAVGNTIDPATKIQVEAYAAMRGYFMRQDAVGYHRPFPAKNLAAANAVDLDFGRPLDREEMKVLYDRLGSELAPISTPRGVRVLNFSLDNNAQFRDIIRKAIDTDAVPDVKKMKHIEIDGDLIENNWRENPDGQNYRRIISRAGRSDFFGELHDLIAQRIAAIDEDFASRFGWDLDPPANRDPAPPGVRPGKGAAEVVDQIVKSRLYGAGQ